MFASLSCIKYRSIIAFAIMLSSYPAIKAQKIFFSSSENVILPEAETAIIGNVSSNTLVWEYQPQYHNSVLLVYDDRMKLKRREKINVFLSENVYQFNFINRKNSFSVIAQIFSKHNFYCQLANFNGAGELLQPVETILSTNILKNNYPGGGYEVVIADNKKYFALVKDILNSSAKQMQLDYSLYFLQDNVKNLLQKTISIPYYQDFNITFSPMRLDNAGNLFFAEYISQNTDTGSHLIIYKSAANNSECTSSICDFTNKYLTDINIKLNNLKQQYIIYALWYQNHRTSAAKSGTEKKGGVFSWVVNENLESLNTDTLYTVQNFTDINLQNKYSQKTAAKDVIALTDNSYTIVLTKANSLQDNLYAANNDGLDYNYSNLTSGPSNLFEAASNVSYDEYNAPGYYTPNNHRNFKPKKDLPQDNINSTMSLFRINGSENKIMWSQAVNSGDDADAFTYVSKYALINSGETLNFICKKILTKDKETFVQIILDPDGNILSKPIMTNNDDYELLLDQGVQVDENSMIFPCNYRNKNLAFAKLDISK